MFRNLIKKSEKLIKLKKSKLKKLLGACVRCLFHFWYYLIKYISNLNENLFPKKVIAMPITLEFLKIVQQNHTLNYLHQTSKI